MNVTRWIDAVLPLPEAAEAVASMARHTGDVARDIPAATRELIERAWNSHPKKDLLFRILEGEAAVDLGALGRVFGEELPSGLSIRSQEE